MAEPKSESSPTPFVLAHLSDVHLEPLPAVGLRYWNLKRLLGWINWHRRRSHLYSRDVLDRLVEDLLAQAPDHIAVTGDLANLGLPAEHDAAVEWLRTIGTSDQVTVIPGNHDIYSSIGSDPGTARWLAHMSDNDHGLDLAIAEAAGDPEAFPFVSDHDIAGLFRMSPAADAQVNLRTWHSKVPKERIRHVGVVVLPRMHDLRLTPFGP